jgi:hypothetical protein
MYFEGKPQLKKDGTLRKVFDTHLMLKATHGKINKYLFKKIIYPSFIHGALPRRDYKTNAEAHTNAATVITLDIENFFPTTTEKIVRDVWKYVLKFPPQLAQTLARITCRDGVLEQGARTSSYLANLVFWDCEGELYTQLCELGFEYTRFVDDITLTSRSPRTREETTTAIKLVYGMLIKKGYKPKRSKERFRHAPQNLAVLGLNVTSKQATLPKRERAVVRARAHNAVKQIANGVVPPDLNSTFGVIQKVRRFHPNEGNALLKKVKDAQDSLRAPHGSFASTS